MMEFLAPQITVLLPVYNAERFLKAAIESILNQTYKNFEFIIINDGSDDGSKRIINYYAEKDSRIVAIHQENKGLVPTLNLGISLSKAPLIARMDADDIALPDRLQDQYNYMIQHLDVAVLGTAIRLMDEHDSVIKDIFYPKYDVLLKDILRSNPIAHPTVMMRKDIIEGIGKYNDLYKHAEDYELWLRMSEKYKIDNLPTVHLLYRLHTNNISIVHSFDQSLCTLVAQLASKTRRQGKADPVFGIDKINIDTLDLFDLSNNEKDQVFFQLLAYQLNAYIFTQNEQAVQHIIREAKALVKSGKKQKFLSLVLQKAALFYVANKKYRKAFALLVQAFLQNPVALMKTACRISRKIIERFVRKVI